MTQLMIQGQALSTWAFSGSLGDTSVALFQDFQDSNALRPIRIQGFRWDGDAVATIKDKWGTILFSRTSTGAQVYPADASGSHGITVNAPLYLTIPATPHVLGGTLVIYGKVL